MASDCMILLFLDCQLHNRVQMPSTQTGAVIIPLSESSSETFSLCIFGEFILSKSQIHCPLKGMVIEEDDGIKSLRPCSHTDMPTLQQYLIQKAFMRIPEIS